MTIDRLVSEITPIEVYSLIYVTASVICLNKQHIGTNNICVEGGRLNEGTEKLRKEINRFMQAHLGNSLPRVRRYVADIIGSIHIRIASLGIKRVFGGGQATQCSSKIMENFMKTSPNPSRESNLGLDQAKTSIFFLFTN